MKTQLENNLLEFDFIKELNSEEKEYLELQLKMLFHLNQTGKGESKMILNILSKLNIDTQKNFMISDFEFTFNEKYKL